MPRTGEGFVEARGHLGATEARSSVNIPATHDGGTHSAMRIAFRAYADDYIVGGATVFKGDRLSDFLDDVGELEVDHVNVRALEDGREHDLPSAVIQREELCIVKATGPRGRADRRFRTRAYPMRAEVGPYAVLGYFHALPTADPFAVVQHRRIVALRPVRVAFEVAGDRIEESHDTLLLMRAKITSLEAVSDEAVGLSKRLEVLLRRDAKAKDLAGGVRRCEPRGVAREQWRRRADSNR